MRCGNQCAATSEAKEQEKLISILPHINYEASGIDKQPTIQFTGVNLQVIDGSGSESTLNGTGSLILGDDEKPGTQTGSHNLLLGGPGQSDSSYGGILAGHFNTISNGYASILGGAYNTAAGLGSTITGGYSNKTSINNSTVSGGGGGEASGILASVTGGRLGKAPYFASTVLGGLEEVTEKEFGVTP
jgi:hypothetical protein